MPRQCRQALAQHDKAILAFRLMAIARLFGEGNNKRSRRRRQRSGGRRRRRQKGSEASIWTATEVELECARHPRGETRNLKQDRITSFIELWRMRLDAPLSRAACS